MYWWLVIGFSVLVAVNRSNASCKSVKEVKAIPLQVMMEAYEAYLDPLASMLYIVVLIWTCVPLVR